MKMQNFVGLYMALANIMAPKLGITVSQEKLLEEGQLFGDIARVMVMNSKLTSGLAFADLLVTQLYQGKIEGFKPPEGLPKVMVEQHLNKLIEDYPNIWGLACAELGLSAS